MSKHTDTKQSGIKRNSIKRNSIKRNSTKQHRVRRRHPLNCCLGSVGLKRDCCDLDLKVQIELLSSNRVQYVFTIVNNGPLPAINSSLNIVSYGPIYPITQDGWIINGNSADYDLGDIPAWAAPIVVVLTFNASQKSTVLGAISTQSRDCGHSNTSIVASFTM